jgi:hypothetical protein
MPLERWIDLEYEVVDRASCFIKLQLDDAKASINRVEQSAILVLALPQCRPRTALLGDFD